ncbi:unnamed protein product [Anisakis simplex]|uniref:Uncharacterized protein n=1 Tax=Anisakis simplex TaxID=6269 RepID=A0A0M3K467_ANISI|nr:unnamed protein product [Anisakis simplex]
MYDKCYVWQADNFCGEKAWRFLIQLNQNSSLVLMQLLRQSNLVKKVPKICEEWKTGNGYATARHGERASAHRRDVASSHTSRNTCSFDSLLLFFTYSIPSLTYALFKYCFI